MVGKLVTRKTPKPSKRPREDDVSDVEIKEEVLSDNENGGKSSNGKKWKYISDSSSSDEEDPPIGKGTVKREPVGMKDCVILLERLTPAAIAKSKRLKLVKKKQRKPVTSDEESEEEARSPPPPRKKVTGPKRPIQNGNKRKKASDSEEEGGNKENGVGGGGGDDFGDFDKVSSGEEFDGEEWSEPSYKDKAWFKRNCLLCQKCKKEFPTTGEALNCFMKHKNLLRCFTCFTIIKGGRDGPKRLFKHYTRRHKRGDKPHTLRCVHCEQSVGFKSISCHIIAIHFREALGITEEATKTSEVAKTNGEVENGKTINGQDKARKATTKAAPRKKKVESETEEESEEEDDEEEEEKEDDEEEESGSE